MTPIKSKTRLQCMESAELYNYHRMKERERQEFYKFLRFLCYFIIILILGAYYILNYTP